MTTSRGLSLGNMQEPDLFPDLLVAEQTPDYTTRKPSTGFSLYAQVAVQGPFNHPFTYGVPTEFKDALHRGQIVAVPLGRKDTAGCVLDIFTTTLTDISIAKIRGIKAIHTPSFYVTPILTSLAQWIAEQTMSPLGDTISCISFIGFADIKVKKRDFYGLSPQWLNESIRPKTIGTKMKALIQFLETHSPRIFTTTELQEALNVSSVLSILKRLEGHKIVVRQTEAVSRRDDYQTAIHRDTAFELTEEQAAAAIQIRQAIQDSQNRTFLLHGVTGSGKTEIYLDAIQTALNRGGEAICLVPEISLTPQAVERFRNRFGDMVGVYHSRLSTGQKFELWQRVATGNCRIMIGARSALFTPFPNLKVIVLDEEHENSYKQNNAPRYHCRDVAVEIGRRNNIPVILGSATPAIESYHQAINGAWTLLPLLQRVDSKPLPEVEIVDMSKELLSNPEADFISKQLQDAISTAILQHEMSILFLNRRGFFSIIRCTNCGATLRCDHCEVPLTYHKQGNLLKCHYCEQQYAPITTCPNCSQLGIENTLQALGIGTQRLEEVVAKHFPQARIKRVDLDTTRSKTAFIDAWEDISTGQTDILIGTQMIARGLHIENVTVVGVPMADVSLFQADFRATERTFGLLTQVAGRAGRGDKPGRVYIQTYAPYHYAIRFAQKHDYVGFYNKEIRLREVLRFPPFSHLCAILATGKNEMKTGTMAAELARIIKAKLWNAQDNTITVLGPTPAPIPKIEDTFRHRILLRTSDIDALRNAIRQSLGEYKEMPGHQHVQMTIDINPTDLL